jgi:membrane protease YdiL (CAAX protease family)
MTTQALRPSPLGLSLAGRSLRPVGEVLGFSAAFLVLSLLCAAPVALLTGRRTVGIEYILPFTLLFLFLYQRFVHHEGLRELGIAFRLRSGEYMLVGFFGSGVVATGIQAAQIGAGWMDVAAPNSQAMHLNSAAAGLVVALGLKVGLGVGEELIFRGYILRRLLLGYRSRLPALGLTAFAFTAAHLPQGRHLLALLNLFLLGLVLTLAVLLTRCLWFAIGLHTGWNFWIDGIAFYQIGNFRAARLFQLHYHLTSVGELTAFRLTASAGLAVAAAALFILLHQRDRRIVQESLR